MSDNLEIDLILSRKKYPIYYELTYLITLIILLFIIIILSFKYQTYYLNTGKMVNSNLEILVNINDLDYLGNSATLIIDDKEYNYKITKISSELYTDNNYQNYRYVYLNIHNLNNIDNYSYTIKIPKENKIIAKYIIDYLKK